MTPEQILTDLQEQIFNNNGVRTDVYYTEGEGALFIIENAPLQPQNIIVNIPEYAILSGGKINLNFGGN